jgi:protein phosphatase 1 regulatory subunit 7
LDFYDNQIERISGLSNLLNLRVLMLGKNRIAKIENLDELIFLDVLDLHANDVSHPRRPLSVTRAHRPSLRQQITKIENLNHLHELRVLNIAANKIKTVENLHGMHSLLEFNLRRNNISEIVSLAPNEAQSTTRTDLFVFKARNQQLHEAATPVSELQ